MVTLSSCLIRQIIGFILPQGIMVVYTLEQRWEILQQIDLQKMPILSQKSFLQVKLILILAGMLTSKIVAFVWCGF